MRFIHDLIGKNFGRLTVLCRDYSRKRRSWICKCSCGNMKIVAQDELLKGDTKSCGCYRRDLCTTHNGTYTKIYKNWNSMKNRCDLETYDEYHRYGGRGITVCDEWYDFATFREWAFSNGYEDDLQIDRIDNDLGYFPENCRWVTRIVNCNNRSNNIKIEYNNEMKTMAEWSRIYNIGVTTIYCRLKRGWTLENALCEPVKSNYKERLITYDNETKNLQEWAKTLDIDPSTLSERIRKWPLEKALTTPKLIKRNKNNV